MPALITPQEVTTVTACFPVQVISVYYYNSGLISSRQFEALIITRVHQSSHPHCVRGQLQMATK